MPASEPRSPLSVGIDWASRITTLGFEFALPVLLGHFIDGRLGWNHVGLFVGMVLGFAVGMLHLLKIARDSSKPT
jgi:ATP synthase protein I